jgi:hypothetical protein
MGVVVPPSAVNIANGSRFEMIAEPNGFELAHAEAVNGSNMRFHLQQQMHIQLTSILQMAAQRQETQQTVQQQQQQIMALQMQVDNQLVDCVPITHALYMQTRNIHIQCILICKMQQVYPL